jgi:hypothetical protein
MSTDRSIDRRTVRPNPVPPHPPTHPPAHHTQTQTQTEAKASLPTLLPDLQAAVASAGREILGTALPEMGEQATALYWAQAGDADGQQAAAVAMGVEAAQHVWMHRATDGANATGPDYMGACVRACVVCATRRDEGGSGRLFHR